MAKELSSVEWLLDWMGKNQYFIGNDLLQAVEKAKEMEKEQKIEFAKMHVKTALKAVENEMILHASSVKYWYLPQNIK